MVLDLASQVPLKSEIDCTRMNRSFFDFLYLLMRKLLTNNLLHLPHVHVCLDLNLELFLITCVCLIVESILDLNLIDESAFSERFVAYQAESSLSLRIRNQLLQASHGALDSLLLRPVQFFVILSYSLGTNFSLLRRPSIDYGQVVLNQVHAAVDKKILELRQARHQWLDKVGVDLKQQGYGCIVYLDVICLSSKTPQ